jgi:hypothetical protein
MEEHFRACVRGDEYDWLRSIKMQMNPIKSGIRKQLPLIPFPSLGVKLQPPIANSLLGVFSSTDIVLCD